jgi:hypothetical protein
MIAILGRRLGPSPSLIEDHMNEPPILRDAAAGNAPAAADVEHLQLLAIFHYIVGTLMMFFACFFIFHLVFGLVMVFNPGAFHGSKGEPSPPPVWLGILFAMMGGIGLLTGWTIGGLTIYSGHCLSKHRRRLFSLVMASFACLFMPFGTLLGVFTIIVLQRDSVRRLYGE